MYDMQNKTANFIEGTDELLLPAISNANKTQTQVSMKRGTDSQSESGLMFLIKQEMFKDSKSQLNSQNT